jgi:UDP-N-acetylmuramate dehydrogenase
MLKAEDKIWLDRQFGQRIRFDESMAKHTSLKIGGPADAFVQPAGEAELERVLEWVRCKEIPYTLVGGGTNLLVRDGGIRGVVIHLGALAPTVAWDRQQGGRVIVSAGAGVPTKHLCALALKHGWMGMNFALGIPGTLGGAIIMNAGTAEGAMADIVDSIAVITAAGDKVTIPRKALTYHYRRLQLPAAAASGPATPAVLVSAHLKLVRADRNKIWRQARRRMLERSRRQPSRRPSAGCFFKNPAEDMPAGRLIDEAGFKGRQVGGAQVSPRHANYIINCGGASASDVMGLAAQIQKKVKSRFGVDLTPEVRIVGQEKDSA